MKTWLKRVLGITALEEKASRLQAENVLISANVAQLREDIDQTGDNLIQTRDLLQKAITQLNANTTTMARWGSQSASLQAIEAKYRAAVRKEATARAIAAAAAKVAEQAPSPATTP